MLRPAWPAPGTRTSGGAVSSQMLAAWLVGARHADSGGAIVMLALVAAIALLALSMSQSWR
jgi:hypothetical protein